MTDKFSENEKKDKSQIDIGTEYIGSEDTEYIHTTETEYEDIQQTEYKEPGKNKSSETNIINQRYKIVETLGKGGMGAVYKALDMRLRNTPVAIKEISLETIENERIEKVIENFENEAETLIQLRHNSIPRVMDFFSLDNDKCYIVMDLIEGETLEQIVKRRGAIPESEVREWLDQLSDVLSYLHSRQPKIIFRDLKPSNIMITKDNEIKLIDFGIARTFKDDKNSDTAYYVSQGFSPPEQYGTGQSDERSDIYSLGATLYSLLIGGKPKIKDFKFESLKGYIDISDELDNTIMLATDFRPENRPKSIVDFMTLVNKSQLNDVASVDNRKNKTKFKKYTIPVAIIILLIAGATLSKLNLNNLKSESAVSGEKNSEEAKIQKAIDKLYEVTGFEKVNTMFQLNEEGGYVSDPRIKDKYYIFDAGSRTPDGIDALHDTSYLVNKEDYSVYYWPAGETMIPYELSGDDESPLGQFFSRFYERSEDTMKYIEDNGAEAFLNKVKDIIKNADKNTVDYYDGYVEYVNMIFSGTTKEELDTYVKNETINDEKEELDNENDIYEESENELDDDFDTGWSAGFGYGSQGGANPEERLNELISQLQGYSKEYIEGFKSGFSKAYGEWERFSEDSPTSEYYTEN